MCGPEQIFGDFCWLRSCFQAEPLISWLQCMHLNFFHMCLFCLIRLYRVYNIYPVTHKSTELLPRGLLTNTKRWSSQFSRVWALTCPHLPAGYTSFPPLFPLLPCLKTTLSLLEKSFLLPASANLILAFLISCEGRGWEWGTQSGHHTSLHERKAWHFHWQINPEALGLEKTPEVSPSISTPPSSSVLKIIL